MESYGRRTFDPRIVFLLLAFSRSCSSILYSSLETDFYHRASQSNDQNSSHTNDKFTSFSEYDFIVVGAGAGGCVVASRLSENPNWTVLLLEAGEDEDFFTDIPGTVGHWPETHFNWGYKAESDGYSCLGMVDKRCPLPRGKGLGGSTIINYMAYVRGDRRDYDAYATAGNLGWNFNDILPYFLKSENNTIPEYMNSSYHGHSGNMNIERPRYKSSLVEDVFLKGAKELGYPIIDYNNFSPHGFSWLQVMGREGHRYSSSKAYLGPAKARKNLHVLTRAHVTRVLIDIRTKKAFGVEYSRHGSGREKAIFARKEVVLSAGGFNSAQILLLSGIGPKKHLNRIGVPVVQNLNVGESIQDHYSYFGLMFLTNSSGATTNSDKINLTTYLEWYYNGTGLLASPGSFEGVGFVKSRYTHGPSDIEFMFSSVSFASDHGLEFRKSFGITDSMYEQMFKIGEDRDAFIIIPMLLYPKSRGRVELRDRNPWSSPKISYNYFEDEHDKRVMINAIEVILKLTETEAFRKINATLSRLSTLKECSNHTYKSDDYWVCMFRYLSSSNHHQTGACKMGPKTDPTAVVDPELRVHGIKNLRVVDVSIFPEIPGAHTEGPVLMVAEKGSDMIKQKWNKRMK